MKNPTDKESGVNNSKGVTFLEFPVRGRGESKPA
jgi:hypothetical protein